MKTHLHLILFITAFAFVGAANAFMLPEDTLTKKYWDSLDAKAKPVFLMGYRHAVGSEGGVPNVKQGIIILIADDFPKLIKKLDAFYKGKDNEHVRIKLAIQIALMEMMTKPQAEIDALLKKARSEVFTAF